MRRLNRWISGFLLASSAFVIVPFAVGVTAPTPHVVEDKRLAQLEKESGDRPIDSILEQALAYDERGNFSRAAELYRVLAAQNVGVAELRLGWLNESGAAGEQSYALARQHYERAAALGTLEANLRLGLMSLEGWGTTKDSATAVAYLQLASQAGYQPAQEILSQMYFTGAGVPRDLKEALKWAEKAAATRDPTSQTLAGNIRQAAARLPQDVQSAREWYQLSAEQQYAEGMRAMASTFFAKNATLEDVDQGIRWLGWAAETGDGRAAYQLAGLYLWYPRYRGDLSYEQRARTLLQQSAANGIRMAAEVLAVEKEIHSLAEAHRFVSTVSMENRYIQRVAARKLTDQEKATNSVGPRAIKVALPAYPSALLLTRTKGRVVVEFVIDRTGLVRDAKVVSSTHPAFAEPALASMYLWRFVPGMKNGRVVNVRAQQPIEFDPNDDRGLDVAAFKRELKFASKEQPAPR